MQRNNTEHTTSGGTFGGPPSLARGGRRWLAALPARGSFAAKLWLRLNRLLRGSGRYSRRFPQYTGILYIVLATTVSYSSTQPYLVIRISGGYTLMYAYLPGKFAFTSIDNGIVF